MPDVLNNRERPQAREPSKCLDEQNYQESLAKEAFLSPATRSLKRDFDRPQLLWLKQPVSLHTWRCQGSHDSSSCSTSMPNIHWDRAATGKKKSVSMHMGSIWSHPTLCGPVDCGLPGFSVRGFLQVRILECIGQYWFS